MKRFLTILILFCCLAHVAAAQSDSASFVDLDKRVEAYLKATMLGSVEEKCEDADMLIASCKDSLVRQHLALKLYDNYLNSPFMGQEAVAIHLTDKWFVPGLVKMKSDLDLMNARIYADFNRLSLVGNKAPELMLEDQDGDSLSFPSDEYAGGYSILFFYDTQCSKCKLETALLATLFAREKPSVVFYAIYTGDNKEEWKTYREEKLAIESDGVTVVHCWDPTLASDYQRKYGVLQTPGVFLVDKNNTIIGRRLDVGGLKQLFAVLPDIRSYNYGGEASTQYYDRIFEVLGAEVTADDVIEIGRNIRKETLEVKDTVGFRTMTGDYLYYLMSKREGAFREGMGFVADSLILALPDVWSSYEDRLKVVSLASMLKETLALSPVGSKVPSIKVPGTLRSCGKSRQGRFALDKLRGEPTFVMFFSPDCSTCQEKIALFDAMLSAADTSPDKDLRRSSRKLKVLLVDMDAIEESEPDLSVTLMENFDLSSLPYIIRLDKKGIVRERYVSIF